MQHLRLYFASAVSLFLLAGCADDLYAHRHVHGAADYDLFYDDYYGPVVDGYWGDDGFFYYRDRLDHPYRRDDGHHMRRDPVSGYHSFHVHHEGH